MKDIQLLIQAATNAETAVKNLVQLQAAHVQTIKQLVAKMKEMDGRIDRLETALSKSEDGDDGKLIIL